MRCLISQMCKFRSIPKQQATHHLKWNNGLPSLWKQRLVDCLRSTIQDRSLGMGCLKLRLFLRMEPIFILRGSFSMNDFKKSRVVSLLELNQQWGQFQRDWVKFTCLLWKQVKGLKRKKGSRTPLLIYAQSKIGL